MKYGVIVIGGGQAGLAAGYLLSRQNLSCVILDDRNATGESWSSRYDSLELFTPRSYSSLPGLALGGEPWGYPTKDEIAQYLQDYARHFALPIMHNSQVTQLDRDGTEFVIRTHAGDIYRADHVIVASGGFHTPYIPPVSRAMSNHVFQIHATDYRRPSQIPAGDVLIVGAGNTGVQIAAELSDTHQVTLSTSKKLNALPQTIMGKDLFWWLDRLGVLNVKITSKLGQWIKQRDPIIGGDLHEVRKQAAVREQLVGIDDQTARFADGSEAEIQSVIWSTGYRNDYSWITIDGVRDHQGQPIHRRGVSAIPGLYFLGLSWQHKRGSALLYGVGEDAEFLVGTIMKSRSRYM